MGPCPLEDLQDGLTDEALPTGMANRAARWWEHALPGGQE